MPRTTAAKTAGVGVGGGGGGTPGAIVSVHQPNQPAASSGRQGRPRCLVTSGCSHLPPSSTSWWKIGRKRKTKGPQNNLRAWIPEYVLKQPKPTQSVGGRADLTFGPNVPISIRVPPAHPGSTHACWAPPYGVQAPESLQVKGS